MRYLYVSILVLLAVSACQEQVELAEAQPSRVEQAAADGEGARPSSEAPPVNDSGEVEAKLRAELAVAHSNIAKLESENADLRRKLEGVGVTAKNPEHVAPNPPSSNAPAKDSLALAQESEKPTAPPIWSKSMFASPKRKFGYRTGAGDATVSISTLEWKKTRWIMNRHGYEWQYMEPDKGNFYLAFDFAISTKLKDPKLPGFYVARLGSNGPIMTSHLGLPAIIEFYKWDDYGSFLGNYADYGNDFSKSETVKFTAAIELTSDQLREPLFLVATKEGCAPREEERFGNPPVKYNFLNCPLSLSDASSPEAFWEKYQLVAVLNAAKMPK